MGKVLHEIGVFAKAELSASLASMVDFGLAIGLVYSELLTYGYANIIGVVCGGITNCVVNTKLVFDKTGRRARSIAMRYLLVWTGSMLLNGGGTNLVTWLLGARYFVFVKATIAILVAVSFNYPLQRMFVFRVKKSEDEAIKEENKN